MANPVKNKTWIKTQMSLILDDVGEMKEEEKTIQYRVSMGNKYQTFFSKFPGLMMKLIDDGSAFDHGKMDGFLDMMEDIHAGRLNLEDTNREVGQEHYDMYVSPAIDDKKEKGGS